MPLHSTFVYEGFQDLAAKICTPLEIIFALSHFPDYNLHALYQFSEILCFQKSRYANKGIGIRMWFKAMN